MDQIRDIKEDIPDQDYELFVQMPIFDDSSFLSLRIRISYNWIYFGN